MSKPNEKRFKAETLYKKGLSYKEISEKLDTPESTIRRWKSVYKWDDSNNTNTRTKNKQQPKKKKRGAQEGNVNAVGNGAPSGNSNALKHGGYSKILQSTFTEEEAELFSDTPKSELDIMQDEVAVLTVREHRLLQAIKKYTDIKGGQTVQYITSIEDKKIFDNSAEGKNEKTRYQEIRQEKQDEGLVTYFGKNLNVTTQTEATYNIVLRLERELTAVQKQKHKILETIARIKNERGDGKDDFVEEWFDTLNELEEDDKENESDS